MTEKIEDNVRFADSCDRCGARLREYYRNGWIPEVHEVPDCIRDLARRLERLENK